MPKPIIMIHTRYVSSIKNKQWRTFRGTSFCFVLDPSIWTSSAWNPNPSPAFKARRIFRSLRRRTPRFPMRKTRSVFIVGERKRLPKWSKLLFPKQYWFVSSFNIFLLYSFFFSIVWGGLILNWIPLVL